MLQKKMNMYSKEVFFATTQDLVHILDKKLNLLLHRLLVYRRLVYLNLHFNCQYMDVTGIIAFTQCYHSLWYTLIPSCSSQDF